MSREEAIKVLNMVEAHGIAEEAKQMAIKALSQEPCDAISREALIAKLTELIKTSRSTIEIKAKLIPMIQNMPSVTQKSGKLDRLYSWLNDMRLGIAPDETVYDDMERMSRESQVDIIDEIMEWIEKHTNCGARMESGDK